MARLLLRIALAGGLSILGLGLAGAAHPALDAFSPFRAHVAVASLACGAALVFASARLPGLVGMIAAGLTLATTASAFAPFPGMPGTKPGIRLLHLNLRMENQTPDAVLRLIRREKPDVMAFNEMTRDWAERLAALSGDYPFRLDCSSENVRDAVAIFSRRPWAAGAEPPHCGDGGSFAAAAVEIDGTAVSVAALHLLWPWPHGQAEQIGRLRGEFARLGARAILAGDFNAVLWSATMRQVAAAGGLQPVGGFGATWLPVVLPESLFPLGLPIDQVLVKGIDLRATRTLAAVGSDHLPVAIEFAVGREGTAALP